MVAVSSTGNISAQAFRGFECPAKGLLLHKLVAPHFNEFIAYLVNEKPSTGLFARWMGLVTKHKQR